ncbi:ornithine cyclodeaminase family protein [Pantoea cypripedii]|uniref:Ornithine cyclodeaminase family protein n=1 Tax=Pantoea cypripedii TaxID=55209 RepID=A0A6B9GG32_PANCY|nr:ornithine cyclodeaminase family protein [Pantoea cypripedii]QGY32455.1 ornithine cyclodeaminase family protein [Pantoea cypripedii]
MKVLSELEIRALYHEENALAKVREGFLAWSRGHVQMPPVQQFLFDEAGGDCCIKSAWISGSDSFSVKISTGFYRNPQRGLASNDGLIMLLSAVTGQPQVLLSDHGWLTAMRTALAGRIVAGYLMPARVERIAIFGAGLQAELQLRQLLKITSCRRVMVWGRSTSSLERFLQSVSDLDADIRVTQDAETAARGSQLIVTATPSTTPLIHRSWIAPGAHITAVGADAPGKQELDASLLEAAQCVMVDSATQCRAYGELSQVDRELPLRVIEIGTLLAHPGLYQRKDDDITVADLTGLGVQDLQIALSILEQLQA